MNETRAAGDTDDDNEDIALPVGDTAPAEAPPATQVAAGVPSGEPPPGDEAVPPQAVPDAAAVPDDAAMPLFADLGLSEPILRAITEKGYLHPTPIQAQAIPYVLMGRDVLGVAQTGTGKTAGFTLPMLDILSGSRARARMPRSLILEPTRELALQVAENFVDYGRHLKLTHALLIGGESMSDQKEVLNRGVDVLIATPGHLLDLFERGGLLLSDTRLLVIDEADRMLDMGFIPDVERIVSLVSPIRQTLFFSATMAPEISRLADAFLQNPKTITVSRAASVATTIVTGLALVEESDKRRALRALLRSEDVQNALIFCNRKRDVDVLASSLIKHGFSAGALHGDLPQSVRFATLEKFKAGELQLLVCSDVAARGIDIGGLSHVFNFDVPLHAEDYVHRIGRTGRAGRTGHAYTIAGPEDRMLVDAIETLTATPIPRMSVPETETAAWAEIDGRKRRGRRGGDRGKRGDRSNHADRVERTTAGAALPTAPASRDPRHDRRGPGRGGRSETRAAADLPSASLPTPRKGGGQDRDRDRQAQGPASARPTDGRSDRNRRDRGPDQRQFARRGDDLGPQVLGFGDFTPDFMHLPRRAAAPVGTADDAYRPSIETAPEAVNAMVAIRPDSDQPSAPASWTAPRFDEDPASDI